MTRDYGQYKAWVRHLSHHSAIKERKGIRHFWHNETNIHNKANFIKILRSLHEDPYASPFLYQPETDSWMSTVTGASGILKLIEDRPWEEIEPVLEIYLREVVRWGVSHWR